MAFRELHVVEVKEILRLWARGHGLRAIHRQTGVDRKTVRRYVTAAGAAGLSRGDDVDDAVLAATIEAVQPGAPPEVGTMRAHLREHADDIRAWAKDGCEGPKLVRLVHRKTEVKVPLRTMQRFLAEDLDLGRDTDTVRIVDPPPGVLEIDFLTLGKIREIGTGKVVTVQALLCVAGHSRHQFLWPCLGQTIEDVIDGLEGAWAFFGGVFPVVLPDNMSAIVKKADAVSPQFTVAFTEYAQERGFELDPARVRKPKDKARVERQVRYARGNFFAGEDFRSLEETRTAAQRWCLEEAGHRVHGRTRRKPLEAFEADEKASLLPAPTKRYDQPRWSEHRVGRDHAITVGYALYSVPHQHVNRALRVRSDSETVKIYLQGRLIKVHPRQPRGGTSIDPNDLPPGKAALATRDATTLLERAAAEGEHIGEFARKLADGPLPWSRLRHVYRLLGLVQRFGAHATDEACARALEVDVVNVTRISTMLEKGLIRRRLVSSAPPSSPPEGTVLRFQRPTDSFKRGGPDASA